jgi:hypothetical protein
MRIDLLFRSDSFERTKENLVVRFRAFSRQEEVGFGLSVSGLALHCAESIRWI